MAGEPLDGGGDALGLGLAFIGIQMQDTAQFG